jgi:fructokinase
MTPILAFGEILWDLFPSGKVLGGAPFNVALRLHEFNQDVLFCSGIGDDSLGGEIAEIIKKMHLPHLLKISDSLQTGVVNVTLDQNKHASYVIANPAAWDEIQAPENWQGEVVFGSLALRNPANRNTLNGLLKKSTFNYFDVNLRQPYFEFNLILHYLEQAQLVKFNEEEFCWFCQQKWGISELSSGLEAFQKWHPNMILCVTKGSEGALLIADSELYQAAAPKVRVADTVGAGDAFFACLITCVRNKLSWQKSLTLACEVGAIVASQSGATNQLPNYILHKVNN